MPRLDLEHLERRELFAADITVTLAGGTLTVEGTDTAEELDLNLHHNSAGTFIEVRGRATGPDGTSQPITKTYQPSEVKKIVVRGYDGNDHITLSDLPWSGAPTSLYGGEGNDTIEGSSSTDTVSQLHDRDIIWGDAGNDLVFGRTGDDTIYGGAGNDSLSGDRGFDRIIAHDGDDQLNSGSNDWDDPGYLDGGDGRDTLVGGGGPETLIGGGENDTLYGNNGDDSLRGGAGDDSLSGGYGNDTLSGEDGDDSLHGGHGADSLIGGLNDDSINGYSGRDTLAGNSGNDTLYADADDDSLDGGAGRDSLDGGGYNDTLAGGTEDDTLWADWGDDSLFGGDGRDTLSGGNGNDILHGGGDADRVYGESDADSVHGDAGDDSLWGGNGNDTVVGGDGKDILRGEVGDDDLFGGDGADTLRGNNGNDYLNGGVGADTLIGSDGAPDSEQDTYRRNMSTAFFTHPMGRDYGPWGKNHEFMVEPAPAADWYNHVGQQGSPTCSILASLAAVAMRTGPADDLIGRIITNGERYGITLRTPSSTTLTVWVNGDWNSVYDPAVPVWVALYQKAYLAMMHVQYRADDGRTYLGEGQWAGPGGSGDFKALRTALASVTAGFPLLFEKNSALASFRVTPAAMQDAIRAGDALATSTADNPTDELVGNHAYAIKSVGTGPSGGWQVTLYNPWGRAEAGLWNGEKTISFDTFVRNFGYYYRAAP